MKQYNYRLWKLHGLVEQQLCVILLVKKFYILLLISLGSISYLFKLCGAVFSGWITEPIGRKKAMIFVNVPHLFAWIILYHSTELYQVFIGVCLLGLGVGLMEVFTGF